MRLPRTRESPEDSERERRSERGGLLWHLLSRLTHVTDSPEPRHPPAGEQQDVEDLHFSHEEYAALVERCLGGDASATETLYRALWQRGVFQIRHFVRQQDLAEDVVAAVLQKLLGPVSSGMTRTLEQYDPAQPLTPWFDAIVAKKAIDFLRSEGRRRDRELVAASRKPTQDDGGIRTLENRDQLRHAMRNLSTAQRTLLELRQSGWEYKSLAVGLGIPEGTVASRLAEIKGKLKRDIDGEF